MKKILLLVLMSTVVACNNPEYKSCNFESSDVHLKIYNDILNELVEQRFYQGYLGAEGDSLFQRYGYFSKTPDSLRLKEEIVSLQNRIFRDTTRFETICYRQELLYGPWTYNSSSNRQENDTIKELILKNLITDFSSNWSAVADTLATVQKKYSSQDFHLCTSKVIPFRQRKDCGYIGIVSFSKVIVDDSNTKALLYYEFDCGGKCGFGEIILVEKSQGRWKIKKVNQLWIS